MRQKAIRRSATARRYVKSAKRIKKVEAASMRTRKILTEEAYQLTMKEIDELMHLGENKLSNAQMKRLKALALAAEQYEDINHPLPLADSLSDIIQQRMFQMRINQNYTAVLLGVSAAKFSLILSGKQKPDIRFIKAVHEKLKVDANSILAAV